MDKHWWVHWRVNTDVKYAQHGHLLVLNQVSLSEKEGPYCMYPNKILNYNKRYFPTSVCHIVASGQVMMTLNYSVYILHKHHVDITSPYKNTKKKKKQWEKYLFCFLNNIWDKGFQCNLVCCHSLWSVWKFKWDGWAVELSSQRGLTGRRNNESCYLSDNLDPFLLQHFQICLL